MEPNEQQIEEHYLKNNHLNNYKDQYHALFLSKFNNKNL